MTLVSDKTDVLKRAELFNLIMRVVRKNDPNGVYLRRESTRPKVYLRDNKILFDGQVLNLSARPLCEKLFELFLSAENNVLDRKTLVEAIYEVNLREVKSTRMLDSLYNNAVKLVSRARKLANEELSSGGNIKWFVHLNDEWHLFQIFD
jgi:hypothetical protein